MAQRWQAQLKQTENSEKIAIFLLFCKKTVSLHQRRYYYLTAHSEQEKQQLLSELIHGNNLLGYPTCADIRKNRIRIKVLIPQVYPDAPRSYWEIYLIKLRYNK